MHTKARIAALLVAVSITTAYAADWPRYMGPNRDGTSTETGLLRSWPKEGPKVLWTVPLGIGFGGPAVSRGKVYLLDRDDKVGDVLRVYDFATGKELWNYRLRRARHLRVPGLAHDAHGGRQHRLHRRSDRRPARDRHQHAQAAVAEEHLEGLRGRRRVHPRPGAWGHAATAAWGPAGCASGSPGRTGGCAFGSAGGCAAGSASRTGGSASGAGRPSWSAPCRTRRNASGATRRAAPWFALWC